MMFESGKAYSLLDLSRKFITFAQNYNASTQAWQLVDDRLQTFYGATFKIPMKNWKDENDNMPYFYVSMQHTEVTSDTYSNYVNNVGRFEKHSLLYGTGEYNEFSAYNNTLNRAYDTGGYNYSSRDVSPEKNTYVYTKYGTVNHENLFKNTGEFVAISPHTLFDGNLWMEEQGGSACMAEGTLNLMGSHLVTTPRLSSSYSTDISSPEYPSSRVPWLTISNGNKQTYSVNEFGLDYWFLKTDYMAIITFRVSNHGADPDLYQSIAFGMLENVRESSYMFPLFVAGGTVGISQDIYIYRHINAVCDTYSAGNSYDLDMRNIALSNSNLLHPTQLNGSTITNFMVLSPQGRWKYITSHVQSATVRAYYACHYACVPGYGITLESPNDDLSLTDYNVLFPNLGRNARHKVDTYTVNRDFSLYENSSPLQRVMLFLNSGTKYGENGCMGVVPNVYSSWFKSLPCGEITLGGKKYLSVPNGWSSRLWYYPYHIGEIVNNEWEQNTIRPRYEERFNPLRNYQITDRLIIPLEEGV